MACLQPYLHWRAKFGQAKFIWPICWLAFRFHIVKLNSQAKYLAHLIKLNRVKRAIYYEKNYIRYENELTHLLLHVLFLLSIVNIERSDLKKS